MKRSSPLARANAAVARAWPGERSDRQPVHTVYGGAHLFRSDSAAKLGKLALAALDTHAPDAATFARALELESEALAAIVRARVADKLRREPVEDFRIDFEDGYGDRSDAEEDGHAQSAAEEVAAGRLAGTLPPFVGLRIKPLSRDLHARSLRTLDLFVTTVARATGRSPLRLIVTIPKITTPVHVATVARACTVLERRLRLRRGTLALELMIETPQSILAANGSCPLRSLVAAGAGRVTGAHFGPYDYTALCGITASGQHLRHPACDFARHVMQVALAQSGVFLSDGPTSVLPIPPHVVRGWKQHFDDVTHSLKNGFYQSWDLHPAQLPSRYAAVFAFFLSTRHAATERLRHFIDAAARATRIGGVFDDAATGQGLLNFFVRAVNCGALTEEELADTGLTRDEMQSKSFVKIMERRIRR